MQDTATVTAQGNIAQIQEQLVSVGSWNPAGASLSDYHYSNQGNGESSGNQDLGPMDMAQELTEPESMWGRGKAQATRLEATYAKTLGSTC